MKCILKTFSYMAILVLILSSAGPASAAPGAPKGEGGPDFQTGFVQWRGADGAFSTWGLNGAALLNNQISIDPSTFLTGTDTLGIYNSGEYEYGEALGPEVPLPTGFALKEAIASWDASAPEGAWVEIQMRAHLGTAWTKWYSMGVWAEEFDGIIKRHSISLQGDANGYVAIDTLVMAKSKVTADMLQLKARLFRARGSTASPAVKNLSVTYSNETLKKITPSTGNAADWNTLLDVPECSQMVYPDGGNVWCSPTSTSMVLGYWGIDPGLCEPRVRAAVKGVYDWNYQGHGNWPFNTAYAASRGMEAFVRRFNSLTALEPWVKAGVPVVMSIAWGKNDLTGAAIASSNGHLVVLVGFDAQGNPIVNDPAAATDADVQRTYIRSEFESVWLTNSGGTTYLIYPEGHAVP